MAGKNVNDACRLNMSIVLDTLDGQEIGNHSDVAPGNSLGVRIRCVAAPGERLSPGALGSLIPGQQGKAEQ